MKLEKLLNEAEHEVWSRIEDEDTWENSPLRVARLEGP